MTCALVMFNITHTTQTKICFVFSFGGLLCLINNTNSFQQLQKTSQTVFSLRLVIYHINIIQFYMIGCCGAATASWGLAPFCSLQGCAGGGSSLHSRILTLSGKGFLGPILPEVSQGNMIFTLMPNTPVKIPDKELITIQLKYNQVLVHKIKNKILSYYMLGVPSIK